MSLNRNVWKGRTVHLTEDREQRERKEGARDKIPPKAPPQCYFLWLGLTI